MKQIFKYLPRIIALPFVFAIIFIAALFRSIKYTALFLRFGGEWIVYAEKDAPKTIADVYEKVSSKTEKEEPK